MKMVQPADRRVIYPRYNHGKLIKCCVPVFLYVGASALAKQSQYIKPGKPFFHRYRRQNRDGTSRMCTRTRRCSFPGYINENAIQNNFQRVPPLADGSVCKFAAVAIETGPSNLTALFMYEHPVNTGIQKRRKLLVSHAIVNENGSTGGPKGDLSTL